MQFKFVLLIISKPVADNVTENKVVALATKVSSVFDQRDYNLEFLNFFFD